MVVGSTHPATSITSEPAVMRSMLVYGHTDGLLILDPPKLLSRAPTQPKITDVRIFDRPVDATPLGRMPMHLDLDHEQHYLTFSFSIPEKSGLHAPRFLYMLEGVDTTWNDAGMQSSVSYAHLRPGRYVFHLKDGLDGTVTESMSISIRPPWWLTAWAKTGYGLALVVAVLSSSLFFTRLQTTRIRKEMLENLVMQDPLTGVPNRRKFQEVLAAEKSRCKRSQHQISVLMIDIDYFKGFNDRFGHQAGDDALRNVARALTETLQRPEDFVGRYGGEEFVIVLPSTNRSGAERVAQKIQQALFTANIPYPGSPLSDRITVSLGISTFSPQTDLHIDSGLFSADQALYQAKRNGRNCFFYKDHCLALAPVQQ
jgi:diguanylate cyclase (GGDEF)-like protein